MPSEPEVPTREGESPRYRVTLDVFEGPLDLLLRLVECRELDITHVSLAAVADQYLAYVARLRQVSAANLVDFLVIAAKLLVIKSRSLLPGHEDDMDEAEEEDVGAELAQQLLEYKRFKEVASRLRDIESAGLRTYSRIARPPRVERRLRPGDVTLTDLLNAFRRILENHPPVAPVDSIVAPLKVSMSDCIKAIHDLLRDRHRADFSTLVRRARSRMEVVVSFLALLELVKRRRLRLIQERPFDEIYLVEPEPSPNANTAPTDR